MARPSYERLTSALNTKVIETGESVVAILKCQVLCYNFSLAWFIVSVTFQVRFYKGSVLSGYRSKLCLLVIYIL